MKLYRDFTTQEEIDAQYNFELVFDLAPYIQWLVEGSAQAREELGCRLDVRFGPTLDETMDIFPARRP